MNGSLWLKGFTLDALGMMTGKRVSKLSPDPVQRSTKVKAPQVDSQKELICILTGKSKIQSRSVMCTRIDKNFHQLSQASKSFTWRCEYTGQIRQLQKLCRRSIIEQLSFSGTQRMRLSVQWVQV